MVKMALQLRADMENVTRLRPADLEEFGWELKLKCLSCDEVSKSWHCVRQSEWSDLRTNQSRIGGLAAKRGEGGRSRSNFVIKCKFCSWENFLDVLSDTVCPYDQADSGTLKTIVVFDCCGVEPIDFSPGEGWECQGQKVKNNEADDSLGVTTGEKFLVDLSDGEWADFDQVLDCSTMVSEIDFRFVKVK